MDEKKESMMAEAREILERKKNQKKPNLPEDIDEEKIIPRLSDELIAKCLKIRLTQNDCLNRGYVLDAFPKSYDNCRKLFMYVNEEQEVEGDEEEVRILDDKIKPDHALLFQHTMECSLDTINKMSYEETVNTHYTEKETIRRHKIWESHNISHNGSPI